MAINKSNRFPVRDQKVVNRDQKGQVKPRIVKQKEENFSFEELPAKDKKVLAGAGLKVDALDAKSIERILKSIESLLLVTKAQIQQNSGSAKPKTVNTKTPPNEQTTEQFVRTVGALGKVWREGDYAAEYKDDFKVSLAKAKEHGVALAMFGKTITNEKFGDMAIYGVSIRAGVCKFKCVTSKGREVSVDASEFISF
jgi:hypothetical protein